MAKFARTIAELVETGRAGTTDAPPLRAVIERVRGLMTPIERPLAETFTRQLYGKGAEEYLAEEEEQTWAMLATQAFRFIAEPRPEEPRVRVFNPDLSRHGWQSPDTVIETNMRDRPFIVDTISETVRGQDAQVHRLLHPILGIERDGTGALVGLDAPRPLGRNESFVHAEITRVADPVFLEATLAARLAALVAATEDYPSMRSRADTHASALQARALPQPWDEDAEEAAGLLEWLAKKNFVFLGYREYEFTGEGKARRAAVRPGSGLGILRDESRSTYATPQSIPDALNRRLSEPPLLLISKTNAESPVHRRAHMDYIGLKQVEPSGIVTGECRFLGLFTSRAYSEESSLLPFLRKKLDAILAGEEALPDSHDHKAIVSLFDSIPKEELFGSSTTDLGSEIAAIRSADRAEGVRVISRSDSLGRGLFVVVVLARERFSADLLHRLEQHLVRIFDAPLLNHHVALDELEHVRLHFYIGAAQDRVPPAAAPLQLQAAISDLMRTWDDRLTDQLLQEMPRSQARELAAKYLPALSAEYRAVTDTLLAIRDIHCLEALSLTRAPQVEVTNATVGHREGYTAIKLYLLDEDLVLSEFLPVLEHLGLKVFDEDHLDVPLAGIGTARIHAFSVQDEHGRQIDIDRVGPQLAEALLALRTGLVQSDRLNRLILHAGLEWRQVDVLRAYVGHMQQAQVAACELLIEAFADHAGSARLFWEAFRAKFDPGLAHAPPDRRTESLPAIETLFLTSLDEVDSVLHDRILRTAWASLDATVRTNFFRPASTAETPRAERGAIALKIESGGLDHLPRPRPLYEVFVHGPHMSGIHLRGGKVARGGIRLSDRPDDFRTEVLGLMKTQMVKNAVIVPVGAKGGFVVKRQAAGSTAPKVTAVSAYRSLVGGLLDLTDNIVKGGVVPPPGVLAYDDADPYLVVAADKGTATFSDIANQIAVGYGFWLGDAFASGGSHGYDHKKEGITALGAWESVRHHFRTLGVDADHDPITVIGIGDMSGDVFGNGMLRSPQIRLRAAFNHSHIFLDPEPDPGGAFTERQRLFGLPRSGWSDYAPEKISEGGGVFPRSAKKIQLSPQMQAVLGIEVAALSGEELIRAILRMETDLLWNGGIGTYVKAMDEAHAEAGDAANDGVRVDAADLRAKVVAEGGNLGFTQRGRIEYALAGGLINTDAIDNSAGVELSDHEVNIKIALGRSIEAGSLTLSARDEVLTEVKPGVCDQVLAGIRRQVQSLTLDQVRSRTRLSDFRELIARLQSEAQLDLQLWQLPDRATLRNRRGVFLGLTRPELAVVLAYSKLHVQQMVLRSPLPDDPYLEQFLRRYFPDTVNSRYGDGVRSHRLRREIIAVTLANSFIDAMGTTFATRIARDTGCDLETAVKAWTAVVAISGASPCIDQLLAGLPWSTVDASAACAFALERHLERATKWIVETQPDSTTVTDLIDAFAGPVAILQQRIPRLLPEKEQQRDIAEIEVLVAAGVPAAELAQPLVRLRRTADLLEIHQIAADLETSPDMAGQVYYRVCDLVDFDGIRETLSTLGAQATNGRWDQRATEGLMEGLMYARRQLTRSVLLHEEGDAHVEHCLTAYREQHAEQLEKLCVLINDVKSARQPTLAALVVVMRELGRLAAH